MESILIPLSVLVPLDKGKKNWPFQRMDRKEVSQVICRLFGETKFLQMQMGISVFREWRDDESELE
jgi:hypothetical protein